MTNEITTQPRPFPWKYAIAGVAIAVLAFVGYTAFDSSFVGTWVKEEGLSYDAPSNVFRFSMKDEQGKIIPVELAGAKPNNFEIAVSVVAKGRVENGIFKASNVLTKCPSKYEGQPAEAMPRS